MYYSKEEVNKALLLWYPKFVQAINEAIEAWQTDCSNAQSHFSSTSVAATINDYVHEKLSILMHQEVGGECFVDNRAFTIIVDGKFALRPKKVDKNLRSANIKTSRVNAIKEQDYSLPGLESEVFFLTLGYKLSEFQELQGVYIVMEDLQKAVWSIKIDATNENHEQLGFDLWQQEVEAASTVYPRKKRVRVKTSAANTKEA